MSDAAPVHRHPEHAESPHPPAIHPAQQVIEDVWSRTASKYRVRAVVLLIVNMFLFSGVAAFAFWLRSGIVFVPNREGYWEFLLQTFRGVGQAEVSLGALLLEPISVQDVPMQIPIVGLLMATLISIPILVAILYRFWAALPFIAVVGFLGVMPWLALTLLACCIIASVRPFRTRFRFMSAMLGLLPAIVYLVLAWAGTSDIVVGRIDPVDRFKFIAPWFLAIAAAALVFAFVLAIAKMVNYRPGAITPLLALMFGLPIALFEGYVGRDELYYRLLEKVDRAYFAEVDATMEWEKAARRAWDRHPPPRPSWETVRQIEEEKWLFELATDLGPRQTELTRQQAEFSERCDRFLRLFPDSRYACNALFLKARAWDRRVDLTEFRSTRWIRFYDDFPSAASKGTWRILAENCPETSLGTVADLRLCQFAAREGDVERAAAKLAVVVDRLQRGEGAEFEAGPDSLKKVLSQKSPQSSLELPREKLLIDATRLHGILVHNRDPIYGYDPHCGAREAANGLTFGLLDLDPHNERYAAQLERLRAQYPNAQIMDNLDLEMAKSTPDVVSRIQRLEALLERFPEGDAATEARLHLGLDHSRLGGNLDRGRQVLAELLKVQPDSLWARLAQKYGPTQLVALQSGLIP